MTDIEKRYSRPLASAEGLGEAAKDRHRFIDKRVLLTGEARILKTINGNETARAALLLLVRICPNITVALPDECADLVGDLQGLAYQIDPKTTITFEKLGDQFGAFDAILSVGTRAENGLPWTVVNSNGWIARVSSRGRDIDPDCGRPNAVGAVGAACLGVCEVFKRLIDLVPSHGQLLDNVCFSFWSYDSGIDNPGPDLPEELPIDVLLVGGGAIGSGTAYLLSRLPVTGRAAVIDRQNYEDENWGTCVCISTEDRDHEKAKVLAKILKPKLDVAWRKVDVADFRKELEKAKCAPAIVLNGLDEIDPRHEVQMLWPDLVIDGAIGSDFSCQVSCHPWGPDIACLKCLFRHSHSLSVKWEEMMSRDTGLPEEIFANPDSVITEDHVRAAPQEKRAALSRIIGKKWCSVTPEEVARVLSGSSLRAGFSPSVPFVACFSSCMIVTEFIRQTIEGSTRQEPRFQLNLLWGPQHGTDYPQSRRSDCDCVTRAININRIRADRQHLVLEKSCK